MAVKCVVHMHSTAELEAYWLIEALGIPCEMENKLVLSHLVKFD